ncbi:unnamed protein product, partial [Scytosiphon promiscuus]
DNLTEVLEQICSNGVPGVQQDDFCCEAQCETCGGRGCGERPGGKASCNILSSHALLPC